jgi:hypothetical protein
MVSLLDIIGPVMVGPSSSHTAGAGRLGLIGRARFSGGQPTESLIELRGPFARTGCRATAGDGLAATPTWRKLAKERLVQLKRPGM